MQNIDISEIKLIIKTLKDIKYKNIDIFKYFKLQGFFTYTENIVRFNNYLVIFEDDNILFYKIIR